MFYLCCIYVDFSGFKCYKVIIVNYFCRYKLLFNEFTHAEALLNPLVLSGIESNIEFLEDYRCHHLDCFNMHNFYPIIALVSIIN